MVRAGLWIPRKTSLRHLRPPVRNRSGRDCALAEPWSSSVWCRVTEITPVLSQFPLATALPDDAPDRKERNHSVHWIMMTCWKRSGSVRHVQRKFLVKELAESITHCWTVSASPTDIVRPVPRCIIHLIQHFYVLLFTGIFTP